MSRKTLVAWSAIAMMRSGTLKRNEFSEQPVKMLLEIRAYSNPLSFYIKFLRAMHFKLIFLVDTDEIAVLVNTGFENWKRAIESDRGFKNTKLVAGTKVIIIILQANKKKLTYRVIADVLIYTVAQPIA